MKSDTSLQLSQAKRQLHFFGVLTPTLRVDTHKYVYLFAMKHAYNSQLRRLARLHMKRFYEKRLQNTVT